MSGGIVIVVVLGIIAVARARLGDATYERIVFTVLKWWFGAAAVLFVGAYLYSHLLR